MSMAASLDLINTTFADTKGPLTRSMVKRIPFLDALLKQKKGKYKGGTYIERPMTGSCPASMTAIRGGTEKLKFKYVEGIRKLRVEPARVVVTLAIPKSYIQTNMGEYAVVELIKEHPQTAAMDFAADWNKYILTGSTNGLIAPTADWLSFVQLNGSIAGAGIGTGVLNGVLDFQTTAAQTDVVFDVAKSSTINHVNQYGAITAWATNGPKMLKKTARKARQYSENGKSAGLVIMDPDLFSNWEETQDAKVRITVVEDKVARTVGDSLPFLDGMAIEDQDLDRSLFAGAAANGVAYGLDLNFWEIQFTNADNINNILDFPAFEESQTADAVISKAALQGNLICRKLAAQWCTSGGAI